MSKKIYKNGTKYNKCEHDEEHPYTMITNVIIRDERLDLLEVGIMTHLLSHDENNYTINSTYIQKISGIGQDRFYKKIKHLTELGYINKIPILGGVNWIINETPSQVIENGTSSENTNRVNTSSENTSCVNTSSENTSRVSPTQRSNNETTTNEQSKNETNKNEQSKNISVVGEQVENFSLGSDEPLEEEDSSVFSNLEEIKTNNTQSAEVKGNHTPKVENECQKIITHPNCQHIFSNNPKWQVYNEKLFKLSNATIAYEVCKYMLKYHDNPNKQRESEHTQYLKSDEGKFLNYMFYIVKYSQKLEDSNIWQSFVYECGLEYKENLIKSLTLS